ncbi:gastrula zinc finger protein xFG20-1-like [Toxorhynchites rutilus septentrionalis]|uniref:gastrula zinc finger protein xFG20-1-like n=1 Tax=Toxorhynchites rutilus septentrionalis TaxID=329112 RepID=UPI0024793F35|nr:gastrula zinc finger protein xFG20-1-like [Toxorhynchites rutilus septentrionalis]
MIEYNNEILRENYNKICRFCLSQDECLQILNSSGINENLVNVVEFIVSKVDENDGLPNNICIQCVQIVVSYTEFELRCQEAYDILQQVNRFHTDSEEGIDKSSEHVVLHNDIESDHNEIIYESKNELTVSEHLSSCAYKSPEVLEPDKGIQAKVTDSIKQPGTTVKKGKICPVCGKIVSQLSKHLPTHSSVRKYRCPHCSKRFAHDSTCKKHIRSVHLRIKKYHCELCSESFADRSSMRYHDLAKHRNEKKFTCTLCDKSYYTSTGLQQHNSLSHEQRKYRCEECGKMFAMKYHLKEHERTHSDSRPFECTHCSRTFKRVKNLKEHLSTHRDEVQ